MIKKIRNFLKKNFLLTASLMFLVVFSGAMQLFAADPPPPVGGYPAGTVLDPGCTPGSVDCIVAQAVYNAGDIVYDNSTSGLTAIDTQAAIDELDNILDGIDSSPISVVNSSNLFSTGLTGTGSGVTAVSDSIFLGRSAGLSATAANNSNFFGREAGSGATNANSSNFFGYGAGYGALFSSNSNFFGFNAGYGAVSSNGSNFFGINAGSLASNASGSNFFGADAGFDATNSYGSNFFGGQSGSGAKAAYYSNFFGVGSGFSAENANDSNFLGYNAGLSATAANNSNFFGREAGSGATNANGSNFFGLSAGFNAINSFNSNFFGANAGNAATNAEKSNFFGLNAGNGATNAKRSNFFGWNAGDGATGADGANFFGAGAGTGASSAFGSIFIGPSSGNSATNANSSIFLGVGSGFLAANAANSIFIGVSAGSSDAVNNTVSGTSILIGNNTSTGGFSNSIALGEGAINTLSNQFKIGSVSTPIDKTVWVGTSGAATLDTATGLITTSDERLKQNIVDLDNTTLEKLLKIKTVTFNWKKGDTDKTNIGFIAQDLEQYFPELVYTNGDGLKGVNYANMTPVIVEAIRELDLKVEDLIIEKQNLFNNLVAWFGNVENGIEKLFAKEIHTDMICVKKSDGTERCVTGDELDQVLSNSGLNNIIPTQEPIGSNNAGDVTEEGIDGTAPNEAQNPTTETPQSETPPSDTSTIDTTNPTESA